ncbi:YciI family protein [Salinibacterium sp. NK8237]|uniref:YciI family protein n=1 Tax=Salinibacterium sp. NK8237 TaxID=2792038 RepID=UPI0018CED0D2|nr:YciI family protein [Salinibacterium sp. NK8237]MBH0129729.1 hypothetical protein [Salinibacterium sp. NK8237]
MQYMILINSEPFDGPEPGSDGFEEYMAPWMAYNEMLATGGHLVTAAQLQGVETATTIRRAYGAGDTITDGPFAETKEQFGGFYLVEAKDLDEALALAAAIPIPAGSIEVRPAVPQ